MLNTRMHKQTCWPGGPNILGGGGCLAMETAGGV